MVSTQTCVADAAHLYDLLAAALPSEPDVEPEPWHEAAVQALRVALHALALMPAEGELPTHGPTVSALRDYLDAPGDLGTTVGVVDHATHRLAFAHNKTRGDGDRLQALRLFLSHYRGAVRREDGGK